MVIILFNTDLYKSSFPTYSFKNLVFPKSVFCILFLLRSEAVVRRCSIKKMFLKISKNSQENTCARVSFLIKLQAKAAKETLAQVFSCEFFATFKSTFFTEHLWVTASVSMTETKRVAFLLDYWRKGLS